MNRIFFIPSNSRFYEDYSLRVKNPLSRDTLEEHIGNLVTEDANFFGHSVVEYHYNVASVETKNGEPFKMIFGSSEQEAEVVRIPLRYMGCHF